MEPVDVHLLKTYKSVNLMSFYSSTLFLTNHLEVLFCLAQAHSKSTSHLPIFDTQNRFGAHEEFSLDI